MNYNNSGLIMITDMRQHIISCYLSGLPAWMMIDWFAQFDPDVLPTERLINRTINEFNFGKMFFPVEES